MNLEEYIRQSYLRPNKQVLESLGASEELISYLRSTPWNTNIQVVDSIKEDSGGGGGTLHTMTLVPTEFTTIGYTEPILAYEISDQEISDFLNPPNGKVPIGTFEFSVPVEGQTIEGESDFYIRRARDYDNSFIIVMNSQDFPLYVTKVEIGDTDIKSYLIFDDLSEGSITISYEVTDGYKIKIDTLDSYYLIYLVKHGDSFTIPEGFSALTDGTNTYSSGDVITPTSDINLTAPVCTVTFDANGGSNPHEPITVLCGGNLEYSNYESGMMPPEEPAGLEFRYWTTERDNDNTEVFQQNPETGGRSPLVVNSDITLYARWIEVH